MISFDVEGIFFCLCKAKINISKPGKNVKNNKISNNFQRKQLLCSCQLSLFSRAKSKLLKLTRGEGVNGAIKLIAPFHKSFDGKNIFQSLALIARLWRVFTSDSMARLV